MLLVVLRDFYSSTRVCAEKAFLLDDSYPKVLLLASLDAERNLQNREASDETPSLG